MSDYINKTGVPAIENTIFRRLQNKFNHLPSQANGTTIALSNSQDSLYSVKSGTNISELYFNGQQLTSGGVIGSNVWEVDANDNTQVITLNSKNVSLQNLDIKDIGFAVFTDKNATTTDKKLYTIDDNGTTKLYFGDVQLDSPHTQALWAIVNSKLTPNGSYDINMEVGGTRHNIDNVLGLTAETIAMIGSTRTITNVDGLSFTGLSPYINGLQRIDFSTTLTTSINNLDTLNVGTANTTTTNATNTYTTNLSVDYISGRAGSIINISANNALKSGEIQVDNQAGTAPLYANQIWIGTKGNNPTPLANWVVERIANGQQTNETYANFWVYPQPITYLQLELKDGNTDNKSGLKTDILIVENIAEIENLFAHQFTSSGAGGSVFDFFDTAGSLLFNAGEAALKFKLAQKAIKFGLQAGAAIAAISIAGNIIYNIIQNAGSPDYFGMAKEMGSEDSGGNIRYTILEPPIGAPDNANNLFSFAMNPLAGGGRLASQGYIQTENAQNVIEGPPSEIIWYAMAHGHDGQNSIGFKQYTSVADWEATARQGLTGGVYRTGSAMYNRRLMAIDDGDGLNPRLRFNGTNNILAYKSEIDAQSYWEINGGYLQPNANSGVQGKIQINTNNINLYDDVYLSSGNNFNFVTATKGQIAYDDTAKTLTFRNADNTGEFIFNDYLNNPRFKIDTANNRLEIPQGHLYFQENGDQDIYKAGTGNLNFKYGGTSVLEIQDSAGIVLPTSKYIQFTGTTAPASTANNLYSRNNTDGNKTLYFNGYEIPLLQYAQGFGLKASEIVTTQIYGNNNTTASPFIFFGANSTDYQVENGDTHIFKVKDSGGTAQNVLTIAETFMNFDGDYIQLNTSNPPATTTNRLYRNGTDLYYNGVNLSTGGTSYFTDDGTTATSSNLNFNFTQNLQVGDYFYAGDNTNSYMRIDGFSTNNKTDITMAGNVRWIEYSRVAGQQFLNFDYTSGTDANDNINFRLGQTATNKLKIQPDDSTFSTNVILDGGHNLTIQSGDATITTGNLILSSGNQTITSGNLTLSNGNIDCAGNSKVRSSNIATNVMDMVMSDTTATFSLAGGSSPDNFLFKDNNNNNIIQAQTNNFRVFNSLGNTTIYSQQANTSIYNPLDVNEIYSRTGQALKLGVASTNVLEISTTSLVAIPTADLVLQTGGSSSTADSNFIFFGGSSKWRMGMAIVPNVEFQALRFQYDYANQSKGGYILRSRNDAVITFTGQHKNAVEEEDDFILEPGMLLKSTGIIQNFSQVNRPTINECLPILKPTTKSNDKAVYGVWTGEKKKVNQFIQGSFGTECEPLQEDDRRCLINSTGEGSILVCGENGNIEIGDYICSSNMKGIGMKQKDDLNHNYTIAKATTPYNFQNAKEKVLVGCLYML